MSGCQSQVLRIVISALWLYVYKGLGLAGPGLGLGLEGWGLKILALTTSLEITDSFDRKLFPRLPIVYTMHLLSTSS